MEEKDKILRDEEAGKASGGAAESLRSAEMGYCPYTTDRRCKIPSVGGFDPENEDCVTCGWRAW